MSIEVNLGSSRYWRSPRRASVHEGWQRFSGPTNWLFIGSQLACERAAVVMSLLQSAKLNGHEPWAYLKDVLTRLPTQLNSRIEELLPHKWRPAG